MYINISLKKYFLLKHIASLIILIISLFSLSTANNIPSFLNHESDSIRVLLQQCTSDTCKCNVLFPMFWKYLYKDSKTAKFYGNWAYDEFKNLPVSPRLVDLYYIKGNVYMEECMFDSAYVYFQKALDISKTIQYNLGWSYHNVGYSNIYLFRFKTALENLKIAEKYLSDTNINVISLMAVAYRNLGITDSALIYYNKQIKSGIKGKIRGYISLAYYYGSEDNLIKSLEYWNQALRLADSIGDESNVCLAYGSIGDVFYQNRLNFSTAKEYFNKGLEKSIEIKDFFQEFRIRMKSGDLLLKEGKDSEALAYNLKCMSIAKEMDDKRHFVHAYRNLGYSYEKVKDYKQAYYYFKKCYESNCTCCNKIFHHDAHLELGDVCLKLNKPEEALYYYQKALELAQCFHAGKETAASYLRLGNFYRLMKQYSDAENNYLSAYKTVKVTSHYALLKSITDTLNQFYLDKNDIKKAYTFLTISKIIGDSLSKQDKEFSLANLEMRFDFEKVNKENEKKQAITKAEIKKQKIFRNSLFIISGLLVCIGILIFNSYKRKKRDNKLLTKRNNEIEEKNQEIQSQVEEITVQKNEIERISHVLHESDEMKLRFFSNISHEFRTPLTLILNPVQNLLNTFSGTIEDKKQLETIYNNAQKLHDLTNQIMDLQKLDAGKLQINLEKADIVEYCLGIASSFESLCTRKNNIIRFIANHHSVFLLFDKDKIGKILVNLLSNAFKFCYNDSTIEIIIDLSGNCFSLKVIDKGIGISGNQIENVFKRYYQVPSDNQAQGTGIGLAYVKELVEFLNGKVTIDSVINEGTKVTLSIPCNEFEIKDPAEFTADIPKIWKRAIAEKFSLSDYDENSNENSVLIVEDNDELRSFIADLLKTDFNVYLAKDGLEGMEVALQYLPDIIISDVMMPNMDGLELCAKLKKDERTSHIPVILLTAKDSHQSSIEGYQSGADDYIIKPFDNDLMKLKVKNVIATSESARKQFDFKSILSADNLKLGAIDKEFIKKCITIIEKNIDVPEFSVDKLAKKLFFSNRNLYRKIKALTNQTPAELIRVYRLHFARQLMQNNKMRVYEIAEAVGYENTNKFRQAFKKQFGITPSESIGKISD